MKQALRARELEAHWKKSEILEAYLNLVPFRGEIVGINALAQTLFDKHPSGLDWEEAAIAAALVRGPNATAATVATSSGSAYARSIASRARSRRRLRSSTSRLTGPRYPIGRGRTTRRLPGTGDDARCLSSGRRRAIARLGHGSATMLRPRRRRHSG